MGSFASILLRMNEGSPLLGAEDMPSQDLEAVETVRRGMRIRSTTKPDETFWYELRQLSCSNRQGLAKLLGVKPEVIARWPKIIAHYLEKAQALDAHENGLKKPQMIPTGLGNEPARPKVPMSGSFGDTNAPGTLDPL